MRFDRGAAACAAESALALMLALGACAAAYAAQIDVAPGAVAFANDGACSLPEAVANANADARLYADCAAGSGIDDLELASGSTYTFTVGIDSGLYGICALPLVTSELRIHGHGATLTRSTAVPCNIDGNPVTGEFRLIGTSAPVTIEDATLSGGCADSSGAGAGNSGGALFAYGSATLRHVQLIGNRARFYGGAVAAGFDANAPSTTAVIGALLQSNQAGAYGGALYVANSTTSVLGARFESNSAASKGGALATGDNPFTIEDSSFSGNSAPAGGAVNSAAFLVLRNSTFSGNTATGSGVNGGAALNLENYGTTKISFVTFTSNTGNGGALRMSGTQVVATGTSIFSDSTCSLVTPALFSSNGGNLETTTSCGPLAGGGFTLATPTQLALQALTTSLGPTAVIPLGAGSVARDAAPNCLDAANARVAHDQRLLSRPRGAACDVGAFEAYPPEHVFADSVESLDVY